MPLLVVSNVLLTESAYNVQPKSTKALALALNVRFLKLSELEITTSGSFELLNNPVLYLKAACAILFT